jgi:transposase
MREKKLLKQLGRGMTVEQIAEAEGVCKMTVFWWIKDLKKNLAKKAREGG